ncbi:hypothetical protein [Kitasatospora purpeofusca]|uniref:hypothetical protein n=1 Tax=Kitasatospora purpeofusca TaxID=67352 RepID=UPI0036D25EEB
MYGRTRRVSLCAALVAAVLAAGTAQAYAAAASSSPARAAVTPAARSQAPTLAIEIWRWEGQYMTRALAVAMGQLAIAMGTAITYKIESVNWGDRQEYVLYVQ